MENYQKPFIEEWPRICLRELEDLEIEGKTTRMIYKSFFVFLRLPEIVVTSFVTLLTENPN